MDCKFPPRPLFTVPLPNGRGLRLGERPLVMGILNITPDSFADSRRLVDPGRAIAAALRMEQDGADVIDVGGESTRPGAESLPADEELARVLPVVAPLAERLRIPISIDTYKSEVARAAIDAGVAIVNDVSGLRRDPELARTVAQAGAALVLMHSRGTPKTMDAEASYRDVVREVAAEMNASIATAEAAGVARDRIVVDPGLGFAKRAGHSYGVLARLSELASAV